MKKSYEIYNIKRKNEETNVYRYLKKDESKNYVYLYLNPLKKCKLSSSLLNLELFREPFYVGSGTKERYKIHIWYSKRGIHFNKDFQKIINDIFSSGLKPIILIIKEKIPKKEAKETEEQIISEFNKHKKMLVNKKEGEYEKRIFPHKPF